MSRKSLNQQQLRTFSMKNLKIKRNLRLYWRLLVFITILFLVSVVLDVGPLSLSSASVSSAHDNVDAPQSEYHGKHALLSSQLSDSGQNVAESGRVDARPRVESSGDERNRRDEGSDVWSDDTDSETQSSVDTVESSNILRSALNEERLRIQQLLSTLGAKDERIAEQQRHIAALRSELTQRDETLDRRRRRIESLQNRTCAGDDAGSVPCRRRPLTYVVYRVLYGDEFLRASVLSVAASVDKVFIFWTNRTWADVRGATYQGKYVRIPERIDEVVSVARAVRDELPVGRVEVLYDHVPNNTNQVTHLVNDRILGRYARPELLLFMEWDMVWRADQLRDAVRQFSASDYTAASSRVLECYRTPRFFAAERDWRWGAVFWNLSKVQRMPRTGMHANVPHMPFIDAHVHNMGLCMSERLMFRKFLIALAFSEAIGDSPPDETWYEESWRRFHPLHNNERLEMAKGFRDDLPYAYSYNEYELPGLIRDKLRDEQVEHWQSAHASWSESSAEARQLLGDVRLETDADWLRADRFSSFRDVASPALQRAVVRHALVQRLILSETTASALRGVRRRFVVMRNWPECGLGNRLQTLISAYLLALLTDRAFLVEWPDDAVSEHWNGEETIAMIALDNLFVEPHIDWSYARNQHRLAALRASNAPVYDGDVGYRGAEALLQCGDYNTALRDDDVLLVHSDQYFAQVLAVNPMYRTQLRDLFGDSFDMATPLTRLLLHAAPDIAATLGRFRRAHIPSEPTYTLGLQIRKIGWKKLNDEQEEIFWRCAESRTALALGNSTRQVRWVLATDNQATRDLARRRYGDRVVFYDEPISRADASGIKAGVIDMLLLAQCDEIMYSAGSTFGRIPIALSGHAPHYVSVRNVCERKADAQPCFFGFERAACSLHDNELPVELAEQLDQNCLMV